MLKNIFRNTLLSTAAAVALLGATSISAHAQMLNGSLPLAGFFVTKNGSDLLTSTDVNAALTLTSGPGIGDYSPIPVVTNYGPTDLNLANPLTYMISNATFGSFAGSSFIIEKHTASFYDVLIIGTYTPGPGLPGKIATPTSLRISVNLSGGSLSEAITLNSPPSTIPEPGNVAMLTGMGLSGVGFLVRRRRK